MGKLYRTLQGKEVDMEKLSLKNETAMAVGNVRMNARGDEIGLNGQIIKTREEMLKEYYEKNPRAPKEEFEKRSK